MKSIRSSGKTKTGRKLLEPTYSMLVGRIARLLERANISERAASMQAGLGPTYLSDLMTGKNTSASLHAAISIARVLGTSIAYLSGDVDDNPGNEPKQKPRPVNEMPFIGVAETGVFRAMSQRTALQIVSRPPSLTFPNAKKFSVGVGDHAMDAAKGGEILPGMEVLCIDMEDAGLNVESERIYAIARALPGTDKYEYLIRRAFVYRDRVELVAESHTPDEYEKIVVRGMLSTDRTQQIFALGRVYGRFGSFE